MPVPKKTPLERALDQIAKHEVRQQALLLTVAVLQEAWQIAATEKGSTDKAMAAEARVYGRCIGIVQDQIEKVGTPRSIADQIVRHVRPSDMPKTPATQKE